MSKISILLWAGKYSLLRQYDAFPNNRYRRISYYCNTFSSAVNVILPQLSRMISSGEDALRAGFGTILREHYHRKSLRYPSIFFNQYEVLPSLCSDVLRGQYVSGSY